MGRIVQYPYRNFTPANHRKTIKRLTVRGARIDRPVRRIRMWQEYEKGADSSLPDKGFHHRPSEGPRAAEAQAGCGVVFH
jgi:hypothetical protein